MNQKLQHLVENELQNNAAEVFKVEQDGQKYWVKRARATKSLASHKFYYFLFKFELIIPVKEKDPKEAMEFEVAKLKEFVSLGINTPKIVLEANNYFVLSDCGKNINSHIRKRDITQERIYYFLNKTIDFLANIHNKNRYHGGAQARNFTYDQGNICTIDLEDSFDENIDLQVLQYRDFLLFLLSLTKNRASFELDYEYVINRYIALTNNSDFKKRLKTLAVKLSFFIYLSDLKFIHKNIGRDMKHFFKLMKILKSLKV